MDRKEPRNLGGWKLRQVRDGAKMNQARFAIQFGYNPSTLSLWETGRSIPDLPNAHKLERDFGISTHDWELPAPKLHAAATG